MLASVALAFALTGHSGSARAQSGLTAPPKPRVRNVKPLRANPGTLVRILGHDFSPRTAGNRVTLGDEPVIVLQAAPGWLDVIAPERPTSGRFRVEVAGAGTATSPQTFVVRAPLRIEAMHPDAAPPGSRVTLRGTGFGRDPRRLRVLLGKRPVRVLSARDQELSILIPSSAVSGRFELRLPKQPPARSPGDFVVLGQPRLERIEPPAAVAGQLVTLHGRHFGSDANSVEVRLGQRPLAIEHIEPTRIIARVPGGARSQRMSLKVSGLAPVLSKQRFRILPPLRVLSFAPRAAPVGSLVKLQGQGFSPELEQNSVKLGAFPMQIVSAEPEELSVRVPRVPSDLLTVRVGSGAAVRTAEPLLVLLAPHVEYFEPAEAAPGGTLTIVGRNFVEDSRLVRVELEGIPLQIEHASKTRLLVRLPAQARSGRLSVTVRLQGRSTARQPLLVRAPRPASDP
ncbi:MAG: IPT/TIG domain-containing protein [Proteobacteria bacterium]|nr:IPT/TIG domain-containing protein [Pseudomonadota bacterium]